MRRVESKMRSGTAGSSIAPVHIELDHVCMFSWLASLTLVPGALASTARAGRR